MVLQFLCPNGHRIHCGDERAGKAAKCPRCGVKFLVPTPDDLTGPSAEVRSGAGGPLPVQTDATLPSSGEQPQIDFLCPAGHSLRSPASLQGQPGQCPTCGSRFYIPSPDEPSGPPSLEPTEGSAIRVKEGRPEGMSNVPSDSQVPLASRMAEIDPLLASRTLPPMATLFAQLWAQKSPGTTLELQLSDGQELIPDHYSRPSLHGDYGLFAVREADGSFTLTAIAWSSVERITMRGLRQLPNELLDG